MKPNWHKLAHDEDELRRMTEIMEACNARLKEKVFTGADEVLVSTDALDKLLRQHTAMTSALKEWLRLYLERQEEDRHWTQQRDPWKLGYAAACKAYLKASRERLRSEGVLWMRPKR